MTVGMTVDTAVDMVVDMMKCKDFASLDLQHNNRQMFLLFLQHKVDFPRKHPCHYMLNNKQEYFHRCSICIQVDIGCLNLSLKFIFSPIFSCINCPNEKII